MSQIIEYPCFDDCETAPVKSCLSKCKHISEGGSWYNCPSGQLWTGYEEWKETGKIITPESEQYTSQGVENEFRRTGATDEAIIALMADEIAGLRKKIKKVREFMQNIEDVTKK